MNWKIIFNELISRFLYFTILPIYRKFRPIKGCIILLYHKIPKYKFERIVKYLKKHSYFVTSIDELSRKNCIPNNTIIITFDDGYKSLYKDVFPIVKEYKIPVTIYLTSDYIGHDEPFWWDIELSRKIRRKNNYSHAELKKLPNNIKKQKILELKTNSFSNGLLSWDEVYEMNKSEFIDFQSHSKTHSCLLYLSTKEANDEIVGSKKELEKKLNKEITSFSYPFGDFNDEHVDIVKKAGYKSAVTTRCGINILNTDEYKFLRMTPTPHSVYRFASSIHGLISPDEYD